MKFCHDDRGWMYANQSMGYGIRLLVGSEWQKLVRQHSEKSKSHKVCVAAQEPKSHVVDSTNGWLETAAFDIKKKKLEQFSISCGSKQDPYFFDKGGGALSLWHLWWILEKMFCLDLSKLLPSFKEPRGHRMLNLHHKRPRTVSAREGLTDDQTDWTHQIYHTSLTNGAEGKIWTSALRHSKSQKCSFTTVYQRCLEVILRPHARRSGTLRPAPAGYLTRRVAGKTTTIWSAAVQFGCRLGSWRFHNTVK